MPTIQTVATIESGPAKAGAAEFNRALVEMRAGVAQTKTALDSVNSTFSIFRNVARGAAVGMAVEVAKAAISARDEFVRLQIRLESIAGSATAGAATFEKLKIAAADARVPTAELTEAYTVMARALREKKMSEDDAIRSLALMAKALQISGATAQETEQAFQMLARGFVQGRFGVEQFFAIAGRHGRNATPARQVHAGNPSLGRNGQDLRRNDRRRFAECRRSHRRALRQNTEDDRRGVFPPVGQHQREDGRRR